MNVNLILAETARPAMMALTPSRVLVSLVTRVHSARPTSMNAVQVPVRTARHALMELTIFFVIVCLAGLGLFAKQSIMNVLRTLVAMAPLVLIFSMLILVTGWFFCLLPLPLPFLIFCYFLLHVALLVSLVPIVKLISMNVPRTLAATARLVWMALTPSLALVLPVRFSFFVLLL
jgi:hypothetical protein